ncbi:DUF2188 domain-containing protein [Pseudomonas prosekii]|jgi:hypothetical protein|uniref:DUF2188 domain-containing protein n=1 Tax=Pseudomonas prosekii TaxID=1148509 RepID=A0A1H1M175_9PSED|nr:MULTISPECIES: DUF2188 domain-containing protein [Pseudomonas]PKH19090.1 hypothetical protein BI292_17195 [Pseudomonas sp. 43NM1]PWE37825.1 DUF2188 domain-containing protein [Pseudomonas prosekii]PWE39559.1 DUF2188 domain-containing protein [Pseudomonas prosekii]RLU11387.1 DUF2188 domain-containing protein [Pseudomonas prosekii]RLU14318.1 DUF2188 domain-containing protein [Pseudomonas prosekii]
MDNYHIAISGKGWQLKKEGDDKVLKTAETKSELIEMSAAFFKDKTASLKIHKEDGTIQEERTYPRSADPSSSKG